MPVIPAPREAEGGESLEPRRWRFRMLPLHSSLGNKSKTPSQKKERKKTEKERERKEQKQTNKSNKYQMLSTY